MAKVAIRGSDIAEATVLMTIVDATTCLSIGKTSARAKMVMPQGIAASMMDTADACCPPKRPAKSMKPNGKTTSLRLLSRAA
jgi:hypothetical protein